jgi:hypothetical protein
MVPTAVSPALVDAYCVCEYHVLDTPPFQLRVGHYSSALETLMRRYNATDAAFITASNPLGVLHSLQDNNRAGRARQDALDVGGYPRRLAVTRDPAQQWPAENGVLALRLERREAEHLGRLFLQNAILHADPTAVMKLVLLR